ncbi:MAG: hypothetical protein SF029_10800 [bacterium]|nr:hypothetical protein [bacterium]
MAAGLPLPFEYYIAQGIRWIQPGIWKTMYELRSRDGTVIATFTQPRPGSAQAEVIEPDGTRWTLRRKGVLRRQVIIQRGGEPLNVVFRYRTFSDNGALHLPDGRVYRWQAGDFYESSWAWLAESDQFLGGFYADGRLIYNADLAPAPIAANVPALPLMTYLGWYLVVLHDRERKAIRTNATAGHGLTKVESTEW